MSKILVTGAAGFIGFHLSRRLLAHGNTVVGLDNLNDYYGVQLKTDRLAQLDDESLFAFQKLDLTNREAFKKIGSQKEGYFEYLSQDDDVKSRKKASYTAYFKPWDYAVVATVSLDELSSLENMSITIQKRNASLSLPEKYILCPLIDARRMEVYSCMYDQEMNLIADPSAIILDESTFQDKLEKNVIVFFGDGMEKMKPLFEAHENSRFVHDVLPSALNSGEKAEMLFSQNEFEDVAYFEPFYLKGFVPTTPKKLL